jgi:hypothetical protein
MMNSSKSLASEPFPVTTNNNINLTPEETRRTIEMLQSCDRALNASKAESDVDGRIKSKQTELINIQAARLVELEKKDNSIVNNPTFWFVTGMLVTGLTVRLVK